MPVRPSTFSQCVLRPQCQHHLSNLTSQFHTSPSWKNDNADYYATLNLPPTASAATIKKQFYQLSKLHHPDRNPNDPTASHRFVSISTAYATLGNASKRERYDREHHLSSSSSQNTRSGSHSSSSVSTPFGSRPASGLSKRRTQFRGPPPSFYRSGGWGNQGAKRQAGAESAASAGSRSADADTGSASSAGVGGGFGPGQNPIGWDNDVPHFDREGHFRTQEQQEQRRRRRRRMEEESVEYNGGRGDVLRLFLVVGGVVSLACALPTVFTNWVMGKGKDDG